jgi:outer membrane biosynthesis protein TonB
MPVETRKQLEPAPAIPREPPVVAPKPKPKPKPKRERSSTQSHNEDKNALYVNFSFITEEFQKLHQKKKENDDTNVN